jgi:hypothetical protein
MSFASGQINRGALGWIAAAYTPMLNAAAYRYLRCRQRPQRRRIAPSSHYRSSASSGDIDFLSALAAPAPHTPSPFPYSVSDSSDDGFSG